MNAIQRALDFGQRQVARVPVLVRLAVLIRNQCRCVIKYHLAESPDVNQTGEVWLRHMIAPHCFSFVDVGANVGEWLDAIVAEKGTQQFAALAFEPSSSAFQSLQKRFAGDARVELVAAAAGDAPGQAQFFEEYDAGKGSSLVAQFNRAAGTQRTIAVTTLDREIAARDWNGIDYVKIDAEGYDLRVLRGSASLLGDQRVGIVQFEYNRAWQLAGDTLYGALSFLKNHGYETYVLKRDGLHTLNYMLYEEYFEYSNFVAVSPRFAELLKPMYRGVI